MSVKVVAHVNNVLGEGPLWHGTEKRVYWTDILQGRLYRLDPVGGQYELVIEGRPVGGFTIQADGSLLLFRDRGRVEVLRDGGIAETIVEEIPQETHTRFNDVIAAPCGRVFCGTMSADDRPGRLYRLNHDGTYQIVIDGVEVPNGMGFAGDLKSMYFTDTMKRTILIYDYDRDSGDLSNPRIFARTGGLALPDGLTVDAEGDVWSAMWEGGCVIRYAPDGGEKGRVNLPVNKPTSVAFGGADLLHLYVTSASLDETGDKAENAGDLLRVDAGAQGRLEFHSRIGF